MKKSTQIFTGILLFIAVLFSSTPAKSQQTLIQITQWNWNAYVHVPADYAKNPNKVYPTIIFFPGIGEIGTNASLVISNGPGAYLAQGWDGNVSIGTADSVEFIIASVQPVQSWPVNVQTQATIQALKGLYRVDPSKLYLTGLSMGGWQCSQFVTGDAYGGPYPYASQVAAEVNVEGVAINDAAPNLILWDNFAKSGGRIACFEQINDFRDMQTYVNQMDSVKPGSAQYTQTDFGDGSHCCWSSFYGGEGATPTNFTLDGVSQNIYQWMAKQSLAVQSNGVPSITSATTANGTTGTAFSYTIAASNTPTSYAATGLPAGLTLNTSTGIISGTPTSKGTSSVTLTATNAKGSGTATLIITVNPPAPVISSAATASGTVGTAFSYTITASNTPTTYTVSGIPTGLNLNTSTGIISGTPTTAGTSSINIGAINAGGTGTKTLTITINPLAPVISSAATATGTIGSAFSYTITASNTPTTYTVSGLPAGLNLNTSTGVISGTPRTAGTSSITLGAINAGGTGTKTLTITINPLAPVISSAATATGTIGSAFSYTITASNTPTTYTVSGLPAGLNLNTSTGVISGTPTTAGTSSITLGAINTGGTGTKTLTITINAAVVAPVISSAATATGIIGTVFSYTIIASNTPASYAAIGLPAGLTINTSTGVISGTPTTAGTSSVTIDAVNTGGTGTSIVTITIYNITGCTGPLIISTSVVPSLTGIVDTTWAKAPVNTITKTVNGTLQPDYAGQWRAMYDNNYLYVLVEVKDSVLETPPYAPDDWDNDAVELYIDANNSKTSSYGSTDHQFGFDWGVAATTANMYGTTPNTGIVYSMPAVTGGYTLVVKIPWMTIGGSAPFDGKLIGFDVNINDNDGSNANRTRQATSGWYSSSNQEYANPGLFGTATLAGCNAVISSIPFIISPYTASGIVGTSFSYIIGAWDSPTSYTAIGLPAGLSVNSSTGIISGVPTASGTFKVTISATNSAGTDSKQITITINAVPTVPVITGSGTTISVLAGAPFSYYIIASNSPTSYQASGLPSGLIVNTSTGVISGTPTITGTYNVTLNATNISGSGLTSITIIIYPATTDAAGLITCYKASGPVTIDGKLTETGWNITRSISKTVTGAFNNTTTFGVLWDNTNLYIGAKVIDGNLFNGLSTLWQDDAIEIYVDPKYNRSTTYVGDDNQIIKAYNNTSVYTQVAVNGLQQAWIPIPGGYSVEMAIPWSQLGITTPAAGLNIGFDIGNDDNDHGVGRDGQAVWNGTINDYQNTSAFGTLTLSSTVANSPAERPSVLPTSPSQAGLVTLMPDPVKSGSDLKIIAPSWEGETTITINNFSGAIVKNEHVKIENSLLTVKIPALAKGLYFLQMQNGAQLIIKKFLIQ